MFIIPPPAVLTDLEEAIQTLKERGYKAVAREHPTTFTKFHTGLLAYAAATQIRCSQL